MIRCLTLNELADMFRVSRRIMRAELDAGTIKIESRQVGAARVFPPGPVAAALGVTVTDLMASLPDAGKPKP